MSRPLRIEYSGAWYHVMNRGRRREKIYYDKKDYEQFLKVLEETSSLFSVEIHAYTLMPNHYHLLIRTPKGNLSRGMRHINGVYTQRFNNKYKIDGSLFRGRYKSILVEEESYLLELVRYIHRNAYKAKGDTIALVGGVTDNRKLIKYGLEIILYDIKSSKYKKLGKPGGKDAYLWEKYLTYSPDGNKIAFIRHENSGKKTLWTMNADGTNRKLILNDGYYKSHLNWTK